ncbi:MAG: cell division protein FtsZ [Micropepsaceae bacterium]
MAINLTSPDFTELKPRILVFGVGGAGGNAVNNMVASKLEGVEFLVANTDAQALVHSKAHHRIQIGGKLTQGLGAGSRPDIGGAAAEESTDEIKRFLDQSHMVFITAGMGGGTGTGAAPVIARIAREMGILTIGVVTKPFSFEGQRRLRIAEEGIEKLEEFVDTLIVIPNQNLFRIANEKTTFAKAFEMADEVLYSGVRGVTDLMVMPGLINLDFADVRTVMCEMGTAMMGMGEADGERRALEAADAAISNPLLDHSSMKGARGVLINITGGMDLTLYEVDEAANKIRAEVDPDANIIVGSTFDERMNGRMRVSVVATGIAPDMRVHTAPSKSAKPIEVGRRPSSSEAVPEPRRAQSTSDSVPTHPVHSMRSDILQSGLAASDFDEMPSAVRRAQGVVESRVFDASMIDAIGPGPGEIQLPRETPRSRTSQHAMPAVAEPKKSGSFSILGISIGPSPKKPLVQRSSSQMPSGLRLPSESILPSGSQEPRTLPVQSRAVAQPKARSGEESQSSVASDDQLDIPAFLRRQAN